MRRPVHFAAGTCDKLHDSVTTKTYEMNGHRADLRAYAIVDADRR
jgi:hypothetical protein